MTRMQRRLTITGLWLAATAPVAAQCGVPGAEPCSIPHETPGCDDEMCCFQVCRIEPFCCEVAWDKLCVLIARDVCGVFVDCNENGAPDEKDIASGLSLDLNGNGVPDECELGVTLHQRSYVHFDGLTVQRWSNHGELGVTVPEPPDHQIVWLNATLDEEWVVRNVAVFAIEGDGAPQTTWIKIPLPNEPGEPLDIASIRVSLTGDLLVDPPFFAPAVFYTPLETSFYAGAAHPEDPPAVLVPWTPPLMDLYERPACDNAETITRSGVPGVSEPINHCAPGAVARCLAWMFKTYRIDVPEDCDEAQEIIDDLAAAMGTTGTGTAEYGMPGIVQFLEDKGLDECLTASRRRFDDPDPPTPEDLADALKRGYDVIGLFGNYQLDENGENVVRVNGHQVTVVAVMKCGDVIQIRYRDDCGGGDAQGDGDADTDIKKATLKPAGTGPESYFVPEEGLNDTDAFRWEGFISICPSRLKHTNAICGWAEAIQDLIDEIDDPKNPDAQQLLDLKRFVRTVVGLACSLEARLAGEGPFPAGAAELIQRIKSKAAMLEQELILYCGSPSDDGLDDINAIADSIEDQAFFELEELFDCDGDGVSDEIQLANDPSVDGDGDGVIDECETPGDINNDGVVDPTDLAILLSLWGVGAPSADFDGDGVVGAGDLAILLANWSDG